MISKGRRCRSRWRIGSVFAVIHSLHLSSLSLDVSRLAISCDAPECTPNRGLWRTSAHETSRNWPFGPALDPHKPRFLEWAIAAAEIWFEETSFNLFYRLERNSGLEK